MVGTISGELKMKKILFILIIFVSTNFFCNVCEGKDKLDSNNPSVQLLKTMTEEGHAIRANEPAIEKVDTTKDTIRVNLIKNDFREKYSRVLSSKNRKIPD